MSSTTVLRMPAVVKGLSPDSLSELCQYAALYRASSCILHAMLRTVSQELRETKRSLQSKSGELGFSQGLLIRLNLQVLSANAACQKLAADNSKLLQDYKDQIQREKDAARQRRCREKRSAEAMDEQLAHLSCSGSQAPICLQTPVSVPTSARSGSAPASRLFTPASDEADKETSNATPGEEN